MWVIYLISFDVDFIFYSICWCIKFAKQIDDKQSNKQQTVFKELQPLCIDNKRNTWKGKNTTWQSKERKWEFLEREILKSISEKK